MPPCTIKWNEPFNLPNIKGNSCEQPKCVYSVLVHKGYIKRLKYMKQCQKVLT